MTDQTVQTQEQDGNNEKRPSCFGDPQRVCPTDADGVTQPQIVCLGCVFLQQCLQQALQKQGRIPTRFAEKPAVMRVTGFLRRWSEQKLNSSSAGEERQ